MKNILIISPFLPWPLNSGGNTGVYYMLEYVSKYENVFFLTSYNKHKNNYKHLEEIKRCLPSVKFFIYDYRKTNFLKYELLRKIVRHVLMKVKFGNSICSMNDLNITDAITPGFIDFMITLIASNSIDIVQIEFLGFHPLVYAIPKNIKTIFIHHELGWVRRELTLGADKYSSFAKKYLKDSEISILNNFNIVASLTDIDKDKLQKAGINTNLYVSTLAISNKVFDYQKHVFTNKLTFVGGSGHYPNFDGIKWFVSNVLPLVNKQRSDIILEIIGAWSENTRNEIYKINKNVVFKGFVDDLSEGLKDSIMVVPINIGSGMRMKILEAANYSIPFISTQVGIEGLYFEDSKDCYISKDAVEMAKQILELANNKKLYQQFSVNVHKTFIEKYSINTLGKKRLTLYE